MRRGLLLLILLCATAVAGPTRATTDGGDVMKLVALAGPGERFAIVVSQGIQEGCPSHRCRAFLVDTGQARQRRIHARDIASRAEGQSLLDAYLAQLPRAVRASLGEVKPVDPQDTRRLEAVAASDDRRRVDFRLGRDDLLRVDLLTERRFPSMRWSMDGVCAPWGDGPRCSTCRQVPGEERWVCGGPGRTPEGDACDCHATGAVQRLRLQRTATGATALGPSVTIHPSVLQWDVRDASTALDLLSPASDVDDPWPSVTAFVTASAILVVGDAAHGRLANGAYYPMVAALPRRLAPPALWR